MHTSPRAIANDPITPVKTTEVATKSPNQEWLNRQGKCPAIYILKKNKLGSECKVIIINERSNSVLFCEDDAKYDGSSTTESDQGRGNSEAGSFIGSPAVDPLIVKFEEGMRLY